MRRVRKPDFSPPSFNILRTVDLQNPLKTRASAFMNGQGGPAGCANAQISLQEGSELFYH